MVKLNLGCGHRKLDGWVNADSSEECSPDVVHDIESFPWPWDSGSVEEVQMQHVLEHVGLVPFIFVRVMQELYRVCAPGSKIRIEVPHPRSDGFLCDPTHVRPVMPQMLSLFSKRFNRECQEKGWPNTPLGLMHDVDFELREVGMTLQPAWIERLNGQPDHVIQAHIDTYFNVVADIKMTLERMP